MISSHFRFRALVVVAFVMGCSGGGGAKPVGPPQGPPPEYEEPRGYTLPGSAPASAPEDDDATAPAPGSASAPASDTASGSASAPGSATASGSASAPK